VRHLRRIHGSHQIDDLFGPHRRAGERGPLEHGAHQDRAEPATNSRMMPMIVKFAASIRLAHSGCFIADSSSL
jgi:hypothetical protein